MVGRAPRAPRTLRGKLLLTNALVIGAGSGTLVLVALALAPGLYHNHVERAIGEMPEALALHLETAFAEAILTALGVSIVAAAVTALGVSWWAARRIALPLQEAAEAARRLAGGAYGVRVTEPRASDELAVLVRAFNDMADDLDAVERRRRALLADLAHELRTPLATVEGYAEGLADGVLDPEPATWEALAGASSRLARLVDDLAAVSEAEECRGGLRLADHDVGALVRAALDAARRSYDAKGVALRAEVEGRLPPVQIDADRVGQVLDNVLDNSLRHTAEGGDVAVTASRDGEGLELTVTDTGEGIRPEALPHVFERFYRADLARQRGGSGIGLTIAREIVHAHGGHIQVTSPGPGKGVRVAMWFPQSSSSHAGRGEASARHEHG